MNNAASIESEFVFSHRYPERSLVYRTIAEQSEDARRRFPGGRDIAFGSHPRERLSVFLAGPNAPLVIFFHGGYWRSQERQNYDFVAHAFCPHGFSVAIPGYPLAPEATMADILGSIHTLHGWLGRHGADYGLSVKHIYACGHSAGGHLAAMMAILSASDSGLPPIRGCLPISGLFDLRPLLHTSINADIRMDTAMAERFSPLLQPAGRSWLLAVYGTGETAAYQDQAMTYVRHWAKGGAPANSLPIPGKNHYNVLLELASADSRVAAELRKKAAAEQ